MNRKETEKIELRTSWKVLVSICSLFPILPSTFMKDVYSIFVYVVAIPETTSCIFIQ